MGADVAAEATGRWLAGRPAEPVRHATVPRTAFYESAVLLPRLRRHTWFRLTRLVHARAEEEFGPMRAGRPPSGEVVDTGLPLEEETARAWRKAFTSRAVTQMIRTLGSCDAVTDSGEVDVAHLVALYAVWWGVSARTAWRHWGVMWSHGLVRQVHAASPGRKASYVLAFPPARVPEGLPVTTSRAGRGVDLDAVVTEWERAAADRSALLAETGATRYGAASHQGEEVSESVPDYLCQAFPLYARAQPPSPSTGPQRRSPAPSRAGRRGGVSDEERIQARVVLDRCRPWWRSQLEALPTDVDLAELVGLVAIARRYSTENDLVELLGQQVASARDLPRLLRYRLQKTVNSARRAARIKVDDDGDAYRENAQKRAQEVRDLHQQATGARAAARAAADAVRARTRKAADDAARLRERRHQEALQRMGLDGSQSTTPGQDAPAGGHVPECRCEPCRIASAPAVDSSGAADLRWLAMQARPVEKPQPTPVADGDDPCALLESLSFWSHPSARDTRRS